MRLAKIFALLLTLSFPFLCSERGINLAAEQGADFVSTPSEAGAPAFHPHLVRPGTVTSYIIRVKNIWAKPVDVTLLIDAVRNDSWAAALSEQKLSGVKPGEYRDVLLTVKPSANLKSGEVYQVKVAASADNGFKDICQVSAETAWHRKLYFISIDALHPDYLKLNSAGTGTGQPGDWLMPNLHRLMKRAVFYPNNKVHIITATDMNHFNYLAGTMTGTAGIPLIGSTFFGFDEKGRPVTIGNRDLKSKITIYDQGKLVRTILNSAKSYNKNVWTAFSSGKNWVPAMIRFPEYQLDRIISGDIHPDWTIPPKAKEPETQLYYERTLKALMPDSVLYKKEHLGNPAGLKERQDHRGKVSTVARVIGLLPNQFPSDRWVMDASLLELLNEDPDVFYILLARVDDAGHAFGAANDLSEWDSRGTETVRDDVSKYDRRASRQSMLNVVRDADAQVGRFLDLLEKRGTLDDVILVVESDHNMLTHYRKGLNMRSQLKKECKYSFKKDFFFGTATSIGFVAARRDDPEIIPEVERSLQAWRVKNPLTGKEECPVIVYNREEMKTGVDKATGKQWMLPREFYSEYYIEHRKPGEVYWADLLVLADSHYKFKLQNCGLGNLGLTKMRIKLPEWSYFIGGHGNFETREALLMVSLPGGKFGVRYDQVWAMDVAPTLERLESWQIPDSTDGKGLPGIDPTLK